MESGRIFVGGLHQQVTSSSLMDYFSQYGTVVDAIVMYDNVSGRSRGFGFVTFKDPEIIKTIERTSPHTILGKTVDCKKASPKERNMSQKEFSSEYSKTDYSFYSSQEYNETNNDQNLNHLNNNSDNNETLNCNSKNKNISKIFVGGLPDLTLEEFKTYFHRFGNIKDAVLITDKQNGRPRGFGFVTFEDICAVNKVTKYYANHYLKGKWVECKKALPKDEISLGLF
ncbi:RNA recognition motif (RRM)-containing protein [Cryptosporidium ryanae]|uniref:RNA recognition motif (RRM)-containing protein n=1 Tax=Cryptosporidium ryanae TaxID=515981 RepID=UPI00351A8454|nr:RNA recognition motif (RRM)-containing protein [Cryptosporidium ryanae]